MFRIRNFASLCILFSVLLTSCGSGPRPAQAGIRNQVEMWAAENGVSLNESMLIFTGSLTAIPAELTPFTTAAPRLMGINGIWYTLVNVEFTPEEQAQFLTAIKAFRNAAVMTLENFIALQEISEEMLTIAAAQGFINTVVDIPFQITGFHLRIESNGHELFDLRLKPPENGGGGRCVLTLSVRGQMFEPQKYDADCWTAVVVTAASRYLKDHPDSISMMANLSIEQTKIWIDIFQRAMIAWLGG